MVLCCAEAGQGCCCALQLLHWPPGHPRRQLLQLLQLLCCRWVHTCLRRPLCLLSGSCGESGSLAEAACGVLPVQQVLLHGLLSLPRQPHNQHVLHGWAVEGRKPSAAPACKPGLHTACCLPCCAPWQDLESCWEWQLQGALLMCALQSCAGGF